MADYPRLDRLPHTIELCNRGGRVLFTYVDQRKLPRELDSVSTADWRLVVDAIRTLAVRGAPAIGIAGAAALALWAFGNKEGSTTGDGYRSEMHEVAEAIASARPTAVNLRWAVERAASVAERAIEAGAKAIDVAYELFEFVKGLERDDEQTNRAIGRAGAELLEDSACVLTHCNAGSLATYFYGTALGVVYCAAEQGKIERVFADETRPVGQGARLTAWELARTGIPVTLICDNMAASVMAEGKVDAVIVGADRIARNGDAANKIGTYGVAVLAHEHGIPFYVAAPTSTIDANCADGASIVIEQRDASEILPEPIEGVDVYNPAFDVTPACYIAKIITENGAFAPSEILSALQ